MNWILTSLDIKFRKLIWKFSLWKSTNHYQLLLIYLSGGSNSINLKSIPIHWISSFQFKCNQSNISLNSKKFVIQRKFLSLKKISFELKKKLYLLKSLRIRLNFFEFRWRLALIWNHSIQIFVNLWMGQFTLNPFQFVWIQVLLPRRKFTTGAAPRQHCQRTSSAGIVLAVNPHEVCRGAGKASKGKTGIVLTSSAALALTFSAGVVLAELR